MMLFNIRSKKGVFRYGVVVNNVIYAEKQSPIVEDVRLLSTIRFNPKLALEFEDNR
jgi:hypothetical protein